MHLKLQILPGFYLPASHRFSTEYSCYGSFLGLAKQKSFLNKIQIGQAIKEKVGKFDYIHVKVV